MAKKHKKKSILRSWFYRIYFLLIALCVVGVIIGMNWLNGVLTDYEATRPVHAAEEAARVFEGRDFATVFHYDSAAATHAADAQAQYVAFMNDYTKGREITWREAYSANDDEKKYTVLADGEKFAAFTLHTVDQTSPHGYNYWTLDSVETYVLPVAQYSITAPTDSTVTVNGRALTQSDAREVLPTACSGMLPADVPEATLTKYVVEACFGEPEIAVTDKYGAAQTVRQTSEREYSCELPENPQLRAMVDGNVIAFAQKLANFTSEDLSQTKMLKMVEKDSPAYSIIKEFDNQWCPSHTGFEFRDTQTTLYYDYNESCFSCRVAFNYVIHYSSAKDNVYDTAYTLYFHRQGDSFKLYNFTMG